VLKILPWNLPAPYELGEIIYKFKVKCKEGFQLVDPSDFGFYLQALIVKNFSTACFILQSFFVANQPSNLLK